METKERLELLEHAINLVIEAKELVELAVEDSDQEAHFESYGKYGFDQLLNDGNPNDSSLADLITAFDVEDDDKDYPDWMKKNSTNINGMKSCLEQTDAFWEEHAEKASLVEKGTLLRCMADSEWYFPEHMGGFEWFVLDVIGEGMGELPLFHVSSQADPSITGTFSHRFFQV